MPTWGTFGKRPIRVAWFSLVLPALMINYFGQGALLLTQPEAATNPFYGLVPRSVLYPMVVVATAAAIVASQALISGAFSLTQQAVQLGYCPRVTIKHTSYTERGQIYIPEVNWWLMVACIALVASFKTSSHLASAYGIAVTGDDDDHDSLFYVVTRERWGWSRLQSGSLTALFLVVDVSFLSANLIKVEQGGWFPLVLALVIYTLMSTWKQGRQRLNEIMEEISLPMDLFLGDVAKRIPTRVPGHRGVHDLERWWRAAGATAPCQTQQGAASAGHPALGHDRGDSPGPGGRAARVHRPGPEVLRAAGPLWLHGVAGCARGAAADPVAWSYGPSAGNDVYLGRESLIPVTPRTATAEDGALPRKRMAMWRKRLFVLMSRNAQTATAFFGLPPNRVVEMGAQIQF
jgi:KUP system potassium uptake protein